jgi:hypothetical protein
MLVARTLRKELRAANRALVLGFEVPQRVHVLSARFLCPERALTHLALNLHVAQCVLVLEKQVLGVELRTAHLAL